MFFSVLGFFCSINSGDFHVLLVLPFPLLYSFMGVGWHKYEYTYSGFACHVRSVHYLMLSIFFSFYFVEKMLIVIWFVGLLKKMWIINVGLFYISFSKKKKKSTGKNHTSSDFFFPCLPTFWSDSLLRFYLKF